MNTLFSRKNDIALDYTEIERVAKKLDLNIRLVELLFLRGTGTEKKILDFLKPSLDNLYDPFEMKGIAEAAIRIKRAIEDNEKVVIYGDYDADGVSAAAVLALFLSSKGLDVAVHIPSRFIDGYGLNVRSIEEIIEKHNPDLFITCDCGISCAEEVEYCLDLGVDVIVTDHHEPGKEIPSCVVINPKQPGDSYPDKNLCGTGVAYKLIQALSDGNEYEEYMDLVAIATIADLVPLLNENRLLVQLGLKRINDNRCNKGLRALVKSLGIIGELTSGDVAYKIAPRLNAAGRIGDAYRAFELLSTASDERIEELVKEINEDNEKRKVMCDKLYVNAAPLIDREDFNNSRAIILVNPEWEKGITGIAAAKFAAEYNRPTFIIVDEDENGFLKGTARGIEGVSIYETLAYCSDLLDDYGGHFGAAGFSIHAGRIPEFRARINEYFAKFPEILFLPVSYYDVEVQLREITSELYNSLELLEPTGNGNAKPRLKLTVKEPRVSPCKNQNHTQVVAGNLNAFAFNNLKKNQYLLGKDEKTIVVELTDVRGETVFGQIKTVSAGDVYYNDAVSEAVYVYYNLFPGMNAKKLARSTEYPKEDLERIVLGDSFGTLVISSGKDAKEIAGFMRDKLFVSSYLYRVESNNYSTLIVSPVIDDSFSFHGYNKIVFTDGVYPDLLNRLAEITDAELYVPAGASFGELISNVSFDRNVFSEYFRFIKQYYNIIEESFAHTLKNLSPLMNGLDPVQLAVCMAVFYDLGFVYFDGGALKFDPKVKKPLEESKIYRELSRVK